MPKFNVSVTVMFRPNILDPQGAAVERALKNQAGLASGVSISNVRVGKVISMTVEGSDERGVQERVKAIADRILANPVMEQYSVEVLEESAK
ncbi:MAG: phosphoribosylformylglycinamidine synthase subunit PurS [Synergistaceae bacterium]|jgi:phosphoribosylformylglycinamidine synthase|nr:phosphoribosylformylglycinamidine synthase subunit PurS [Synergistaceae bacterium]